jgi:SAM-dependent methyltransferase
VHEYDLIADWYAAERGMTSGVPELRELLVRLPAGASVVDLGCGNGRPLTGVLVEQGCQVLAVDSSPRMLDRFRENFPGVPALCAAIEQCDFDGRTFDAAVAWGVLFHLTQEAQERAVANVAATLKLGGWLLFTSGDQDGSIDGQPMNGVPFHYHSFSVEGYRALLARHGLALEWQQRDAGGNCYYFCRKVLPGEEGAVPERPIPGEV